MLSVSCVQLKICAFMVSVLFVDERYERRTARTLGFYALSISRI
jgi:hypothetical protein